MIATGEPAAALETLDELPVTAELAFLRGTAHERDGDTIAALERYREALALDPENRRARNSITRIEVGPRRVERPSRALPAARAD